MKELAQPWYNAGSTGLAATVLLGVAGIVVGVWAAFRAAKPRQELAYEVRAIVPLLSPKAITVDYLDIYYDGEQIDQPHVIELHLYNRGRRDIATKQFDQDRPLQVDVGALIRTVLNSESSPLGYRSPRIAVDGSNLRIGPDLIKKKQELRLSLLVDGPEPKVTIPEPPFVDIEVRNRTEFAPTSAESQKMQAGMSAAAFFVLGALTLSTMEPTSSVAAAAEVAGFFIAGSVILAMTAYLLRSAWRARHA